MFYLYDAIFRCSTGIYRLAGMLYRVVDRRSLRVCVWSLRRAREHRPQQQDTA